MAKRVEKWDKVETLMDIVQTSIEKGSTNSITGNKQNV